MSCEKLYHETMLSGNKSVHPGAARVTPVMPDTPRPPPTGAMTFDQITIFCVVVLFEMIFSPISNLYKLHWLHKTIRYSGAPDNSHKKCAKFCAN